MADPVTWVTIIGAVAGAVGQMSAASAKSDVLRNQAQQQEMAATVAKQEGQNANDVAQVNAAANERKTNYQLSQARAAIGQSGTDFSGSNLDVLGQSAENAVLDSMNIKYAGILQQNSYENQSLLTSKGASNLRGSADATETAGYFGAASSLLGGGSGYLNGQTKIKTAKAASSGYVQ